MKLLLLMAFSSCTIASHYYNTEKPVCSTLAYKSYRCETTMVLTYPPRYETECKAIPTVNSKSVLTAPMPKCENESCAIVEFRDGDTILPYRSFKYKRK